MRPSDYFYHLPDELIAQSPADPRDSSRLMHLDRSTGEVRHLAFSDFPALLRPSDLLVVNDTRVVPARLYGEKDTGARLEVLLLGGLGPRSWEALIRPGKRVKAGTSITVSDDCVFVVDDILGDGLFRVTLTGDAPPLELLERHGVMPLPPYIKRKEARPEDKSWYQTLFAHPQKAGSSAAPTAGLHFSPAVLERIAQMGVETARVTLDVGLGTFLPVRVDNFDDHRMHRERWQIEEGEAAKINRALDEGSRVVAVGTTATRVLETSGAGGRVTAGEGYTELFIRPGYQFRVVGGLLTNFHLPESTLLLLVSAFVGKERLFAAYREAVENKYRFFSYGDAMFIG